MRLLPVALLLTCVIAAEARAGAWPRDRGTGFIAVTQRFGWPQDTGSWTSRRPTQDYTSFYLEYGLTERLTLGLDLGRSVSGDDKSVAFLQYPLRNRDRGPKVTVQLGLGQIGEARILRPGLSAGWGMERGWLSFDTVVEHALDSGDSDVKLDITWGRNLERDRKLIVQLQSGAPSGDPAFLRVESSMVVPLTARTHAEFGGSWGLVSDQSMGLKLGVWHRF